MVKLAFASVIAMLAASAACSKGDPSQVQGTWLREEKTFSDCSVNAPRYQCNGAGTQFFEGEKATAGLARCKSLGFTRVSDVAYPLNGESYRILSDSEVDSALAKGHMVGFMKPL